MGEKRESNPPKGPQRVRRRTFLAGAGGLSMMAMQPRPGRAAKASPKKYRTGVIGHTGRGGYGHGLDKAWRDIPQAEIVGVDDPNPGGLAQAVKRLGTPKG